MRTMLEKTPSDVDFPNEITCCNPHCRTTATEYMVDDYGNKFCEVCGAKIARFFTDD